MTAVNVTTPGPVVGAACGPSSAQASAMRPVLPSAATTTKSAEKNTRSAQSMRANTARGSVRAARISMVPPANAV